MGNVMLQQALSVFGGLMVIAALFLLWWASRSPWLLVSIAAEVVSLLLRFVVALVPDLYRTAPMLMQGWSFIYLVFAVGLLGYAVTQTTQNKPP